MDTRRNTWSTTNNTSYECRPNWSRWECSPSLFQWQRRRSAKPFSCNSSVYRILRPRQVGYLENVASSLDWVRLACWQDWHYVSAAPKSGAWTSWMRTQSVQGGYIRLAATTSMDVKSRQITSLTKSS